MRPAQRIGIVGGTFNPFHNGHLAAPLALFETMEWSKLIYVPAYRQPFKTGERTASMFDRVAMTLLATESEERAEISYVELERGGISYSVDTLEHFRSRDSETVFDLVIGDDNLEQLLEWRSLDRIFEIANFVVLSRSGGETIPVSLKGRVSRSVAVGSGAIVLADNPTVPISSTSIRQRVQNGVSIEGLVDPRVATYIEKYGLYRAEEE